MLVNSGTLAFAAAGDIQNAVERLQRDPQEFCVTSASGKLQSQMCRFASL